MTIIIIIVLTIVTYYSYCTHLIGDSSMTIHWIHCFRQVSVTLPEASPAASINAGSSWSTSAWRQQWSLHQQRWLTSSPQCLVYGEFMAMSNIWLIMGFQSHRGTPIAGWLMRENPILKHGWFGDTFRKPRNIRKSRHHLQKMENKSAERVTSPAKMLAWAKMVSEWPAKAWISSAMVSRRAKIVSEAANRIQVL